MNRRIVRACLLVVIGCLLTTFTSLHAQGGADDTKHTFAPINTAIPSLSIAPDARGGGMGDNGVASTPDVNSQYWNPAKYAFAFSKAGVSLSYTPWLRKLVNDVALVNLSGYYKLGQSDLQAIGAATAVSSPKPTPWRLLCVLFDPIWVLRQTTIWCPTMPLRLILLVI